MPNESLSEALASTEIVETATPAASSEQTVDQPTSATDSSLQTTESVEQPAVETKPEEPKSPEQEQEVQPEPIAKVRAWGEGLEKDLNSLKVRINEFGGESQLQIMQPFLKVAAEMPRNDQELDAWQGQAWTALKGTLMPQQVSALQTQATAEYTASPAGQMEILKTLFGNGADVPSELPKVIAEFAKAYIENPYVMDLIRPGETDEERDARVASEARERARDEEVKGLKAESERRDAETQQYYTQQAMTQVFEVSLAPLAEVKKQFGLEFQPNAGDTPEIGAFKQRVSNRYDKLVRIELANDQELNRLASYAEQCAGQKDPKQRDRATNQFAPQMKQRTMTICAQVAKDLKEDLTLFSPGTSDQAKAANLKDLPAQVLGGGVTTSTSNGFDLSDMPAPGTRAHEAWVAKMIAAQTQRSNTPGVLQAG